MAVLLETSAGEITIDLFVDECPSACLNFLKLCKYKYYNGCLFFNVQQNFMAQTGDPTGTGTGGTSIFGIDKGAAHAHFRGEVKKERKMNKVGLVGFSSSASEADNMCRSQFFITLRGEDYDEGRYTIFGEVAEGIETLQKINNLYCDERSRPYQDVRIKHTIILDDPFEDPGQVIFPPASPTFEYPPEEAIRRRIAYEDEIGEVNKQATADLEASIRIKEAQSRALILEMTGDIPDADIKPPREVLFICKLNSVTRDADLQILFSTFGNIKSCQIVRDPKTGDSLNYAFIEYDNESSCVKAYEKMNNVLIDDRRIKVDFSQSVSHLWNRFTQQTRKTGGGIRSQNQGVNGGNNYNIKYSSSSSNNNNKNINNNSSSSSIGSNNNSGGSSNNNNSNSNNSVRSNTSESNSESSSKYVISQKFGQRNGSHRKSRSRSRSRDRHGQDRKGGERLRNDSRKIRSRSRGRDDDRRRDDRRSDDRRRDYSRDRGRDDRRRDGDDDNRRRDDSRDRNRDNRDRDRNR